LWGNNTRVVHRVAGDTVGLFGNGNKLNPVVFDPPDVEQEEMLSRFQKSEPSTLKLKS